MLAVYVKHVCWWLGCCCCYLTGPWLKLLRAWFVASVACSRALSLSDSQWGLRILCVNINNLSWALWLRTRAQQSSTGKPQRHDFWLLRMRKKRLHVFSYRLCQIESNFKRFQSSSSWAFPKGTKGPHPHGIRRHSSRLPNTYLLILLFFRCCWRECVCQLYVSAKLCVC